MLNSLFLDWITHSILDSIVDSFFPFLEEIEKEVTAIDHLVYAGNPEQVLETIPSMDPASSSPQLLSVKSDPYTEKIFINESNENCTPAERFRDTFRRETQSKRPRFTRPRLNLRLLFRRAKRHVSHAWEEFWARPVLAPSATQLTLRRMARTRKIVTVLGRLLATKSDVITQIRKRLTKSASEGNNGEEFEIAIYMGDVQG